ncbi:bacterioferritin [Gynuella sunshinyii]|uniref:Bacterioferritin n=1 Tax=Gynuella sunshinyii YC6258 TaxID=1445510 RepID=A0A0C5VSN1_9GAMM|nr:bacterioferritin [Gynuella sunshinyii]AJQ93284.1 bacterioferritin (cytochrome b1) [Gynuella sunshinyii YC6258]
MKGDSNIINELNVLLEGELTAIDQYFIHSRMYEDWGISKIHERLNHEMEEERGHADALIKRILFLEGKPDLSKRSPLNVGTDVISCLQSDLALEYSVVKSLKHVIALCEQAEDYVTRDMLLQQLQDTEEDHTYWLEQQLRLIKLTGLENYIQSQM